MHELEEGTRLSADGLIKPRVEGDWDKCAKKYKQKLEILLSEGLPLDDLEKEVKELGYTSLLHLFCGTRHQYLDCIKQILTSGVDANIPDEFGKRPLMYAIQRKQGNDAISTMDCLLEKDGRSVLSRTSKHFAETYYCCGFRCSDDRTLDMELKSDLTESLNNGSNNNRAPIDKGDKMGWTALIYACRYGDEKKIKCLLDYGADCNVKDYRGLSVVCHGAGRLSVELLKLLFRVKKDCNKDEESSVECHESNYCYKTCVCAKQEKHVVSSPLISALLCGNFDNFFFLIEKGFSLPIRASTLVADICIEDTPFSSWIATFLFSKLPVNEIDPLHKVTPLQCVIKFGYTDAAISMLKQEDITSENLEKSLEESIRHRSPAYVINTIVRKLLQQQNGFIPFETIYLLVCVQVELKTPLYFT